ncbi:hypothetical protein FsymDg_1215 [Candidatus Protofrankia datiscae]|uniref:Uncharacterized protein n=1 Tax=Candidatus Protofrankia datiscae TaxID=2716812 RepID=F8B081_9ACTN|nr:hypothetical protein FsymDg_1215 [Candidatus Protofrankia datiscae]
MPDAELAEIIDGLHVIAANIGDVERSALERVGLREHCEP